MRETQLPFAVSVNVAHLTASKPGVESSRARGSQAAATVRTSAIFRARAIGGLLIDLRARHDGLILGKPIIAGAFPVTEVSPSHQNRHATNRHRHFHNPKVITCQ